jgi:hypothetical protein
MGYKGMQTAGRANKYVEVRWGSEGLDNGLGEVELDTSYYDANDRQRIRDKLFLTPRQAGELAGFLLEAQRDLGTTKQGP